MAGEMRPLNAVMQELKALTKQKATGLLYVVTSDNRFAYIKLLGGRIEEVSFKSRFNDEAVELLSRVENASARFQPGAVSPGTHAPLGEAAMRWLSGGYENQQSAPLTPAAKPQANINQSADLRARQQQIIEKIALPYFGPIASLICAEALSNSKDIDKVLQQIAANLAERDEAQRFIVEARTALAKAP